MLRVRRLVDVECEQVGVDDESHVVVSRERLKRRVTSDGDEHDALGSDTLEGSCEDLQLEGRSLS